MGKTPWSTAAWVAAMLVACLANAARAEEGADEETLGARIEALEDAVERHDRAEDLKALRKDLDRAAALYEEGEGQKSLREDLMCVFKTVLKASKHSDLIEASLVAICATRDEDAPTLIKPYLRQKNRKETDPVLVTAIEAAGGVPHKSLVAPLLKLVQSSKHCGVAAAAMLALGHYGKLKRHREKILVVLVKETEKCKPGGQPRTARGGGTSVDPNAPITGGVIGRDTGPGARWQALSAALPRALNDLTGRQAESAMAWFDFVDEYKGNLHLLFEDRDAK